MQNKNVFESLNYSNDTVFLTHHDCVFVCFATKQANSAQ